jgi:hypothetical protein
MGGCALFPALLSCRASEAPIKTWLMARVARPLKQHCSVIAGVNRRQLNKIVSSRYLTKSCAHSRRICPHIASN